MSADNRDSLGRSLCRGRWLGWLLLCMGCLPACRSPQPTIPSTEPGGASVPARSEPAPSSSPELTEAVTEARKKLELETNPKHAQGALVYTIAGSDGGRPQVTARLEFPSGGYRGVPAETARPNTVYDRSTQTYVLRITAPGYQPFARNVTFEPGRVLVWNDIVLERVTAETGATINGAVWLEDDADPTGVAVAVDDQRLTADERGRFSATGLREGQIRVSAHKPGYSGQSVSVALTRGGAQNCELRLFRTRFALVRWSCQLEPGGPLAGWVRHGAAVVSPGGLDRVSFLQGFTQVGRESDFGVRQRDAHLVISNFDSRGGDDRPGIMRTSARGYEQLSQPPVGDYNDTRDLKLDRGAAFVFRCFDGQHFAKMEVLDVAEADEPFAQRTVAARVGCDLNAAPDAPGLNLPSIAVLDFDAEDALRAEADALSDLCRKQVQETQRFILVDRNTIRLVLREEDLAASMRCDDTHCLVNYGAKLRAQKLVHGRLARVAEGLMLTLKVVDVGTAKIDGMETARTGPDAKDLFDVIEPTSCALLSQALRSAPPRADNRNKTKTGG